MTRESNAAAAVDDSQTTPFRTSVVSFYVPLSLSLSLLFCSLVAGVHSTPEHAFKRTPGAPALLFPLHFVCSIIGSAINTPKKPAHPNFGPKKKKKKKRKKKQPNKPSNTIDRSFPDGHQAGWLFFLLRLLLLVMLWRIWRSAQTFWVWRIWRMAHGTPKQRLQTNAAQ